MDNNSRLSMSMPSLAVQLLMVLGCVCIVFCPSLFAEYSIIDDTDAVAMLGTLKELSLTSIFFFPESGVGGYYRPLLLLSQHVDWFLWNLDSLATHAENILLHAVNAVWIFFIARIYVAEDQRSQSPLPFIAALLFALHPVTTESVNWYSGRTDLLAAFFGLPALYTILVWKERGKGVLFLLAAIFFAVMGLLAKEAILGLFLAIPFLLMPTKALEMSWFYDRWRIILPLLTASLLIALYTFLFWPSLLFAAILLILLYYRLESTSSETSLADLSKILRVSAWICSMGCAVVLLSYGIRKLVFQKQMSIFGQTAFHIVQDPEYAIGQFLGALAFYVKKFILPLPLNFAVREVDPMYQLAGIVLLFLATSLLLWRSRASLFFLAGIITLSPVLPFVFGTIAWTSFAERYMYLSVGLWSVSAALLIDSARNRRVAAGLIFCLILLFGVISFKRNILWQSNLDLVADTVERSPNFRVIRGVYMKLLLDNGKYDAAAKQYDAALLLPHVGYDPEFDMIYAEILFKQGKVDKSREVLDRIDKKTPKNLEKVKLLRKSLNLI